MRRLIALFNGYQPSVRDRLAKLAGLFLVLTLTASLVSPLIAHATPNLQINYQGTLTNLTGALVPDGNYSMVFSLYSAATGGSTLWSETQTVPLVDGQFSAMLGAVSSLAGVDFNQILYLGVTVGTDSEMTPRKILGTVPTAFYAQQAWQLGGVGPGQFLRSDTTNATTTVGTFVTINQIGAGAALDVQNNSQSSFLVGANGLVTVANLATFRGGLLANSASSTVTNLTTINATSTNATTTNLFATNLVGNGERLAGNLTFTGAARTITNNFASGALTLSTADNASGNSGGLAVSLGNALGQGGAISLTAGSANGPGGIGGGVTLQAGSAITGGAVNITAGVSYGGSSSGSVTLSGGSNVAGGAASIMIGGFKGLSGVGGDLTLTPGSAGPSGTIFLAGPTVMNNATATNLAVFNAITAPSFIATSTTASSFAGNLNLANTKGLVFNGGASIMGTGGDLNLNTTGISNNINIDSDFAGGAVTLQGSHINLQGTENDITGQVKFTSFGSGMLKLVNSNVQVGIAGMDYVASSSNNTWTGTNAFNSAATTTFAGFIDVLGTGANATSTFASNLWIKGTLRSANSYNGDIFFANNFRITEGDMSSGVPQKLLFNGPANQPVLTLMDNGNVGIGVTDPTQRLAVAGTIVADAIVSSTTDALASGLSGLVSVVADVNGRLTKLEQNVGSVPPPGNQDFLRVRSIINENGAWQIDENGILTASEIHASKLCLGETCVDENQLKKMLGQQSPAPTLPPTAPVESPVRSSSVPSISAPVQPTSTSTDSSAEGTVPLSADSPPPPPPDSLPPQLPNQDAPLSTPTPSVSDTPANQ